MKALIGTCVLLDVFQAREPFFEASKTVLLACANKAIEGMTTAKAITDVYYLMHGHFHDKEKSVDVVRKLYKILTVADTTSKACLSACFSVLPDYEDAVMDETAQAENADLIVTRNLGDYRKAKTETVSPDELVARLGLG